eukprot:228494-Prorocentrum_minimum.AAC.1
MKRRVTEGLSLLTSVPAGTRAGRPGRGGEPSGQRWVHPHALRGVRGGRREHHQDPARVRRGRDGARQGGPHAHARRGGRGQRGRGVRAQPTRRGRERAEPGGALAHALRRPHEPGDHTATVVLHEYEPLIS